MEKMFSFGAKIWPGLSKLAEEAGEVVQVIGKLIMTQGDVNHWDGTNLKDRLEEEVADVIAACTFVIDYCGLDEPKVLVRAGQKLGMFKKWHEAGDPVR